MKNKKPLWITLISLDVIITVALFAISIIMLSNVSKTEAERMAMPKGLVRWLVYELKPWQYGVMFVVPLFILLAVNIVGLVIYVKKSTQRAPVQVNDLSDEQKEALRQELLRDLQGGSQTPAQPAEVKEEPRQDLEKPEEPKE